MSKENVDIKYELIPYDGFIGSKEFDFDKAIYDLNSQIELLSSQADNLDYVVAIASGIACGLLDILWVGEFDLTNGRSIASDKVDAFVKKTAEMFEGEKFDDVKSAVKALEKRFPIPSDGNTPDFGGGLQHHLRDFAHHPTIVGLAFSLLTQFTEKSYGTDVNGVFLVVDVPEKSKPFIGKDVPQKILMGTITWFFHLVSDVAGSSSTAGVTGGTGIPGPILALAKEISAIPFFKDIKVDDDMSLSLFLSKLFNGTLMMQRDENGQIIKESVVKFDLRGELGVAVELCKQAVPVIANECIVRAFYFIRRLAMAMKEKCVSCLADMKKIDWNSVKPANTPTIARMLTVSTGVFTALDMGEAIATQKYWVSINYVGVGRFAVAIGSDVSWGLKARNVKKVRDVYENIKQQTFRKADADIYKRIGADMDIQMDKLGLSLEQTEILYNLEYYKTLNDIERTNIPITREGVKELKTTWLQDWAKFISDGFESFTQVPGAKMHWYTMDELQQCIAGQNPNEPWYRLILLEAMLFEPYYPLGMEKDKKGNDVPCKKYKHLNNPINGFKKSEGDRFLNEQFTGKYCEKEYVKRLRKSYDKRMNELKAYYQFKRNGNNAEFVSKVCEYFNCIKSDKLDGSDLNFLSFIASEAGVPQYYDMLIKRQNRDEMDMVEQISLGMLSSFFYDASLCVDEQGNKLHRFQKQILEKFSDDTNRFVLTAPTSFGKTFIVYQILQKMKYSTILLIFPTISLLTENYERIKAYPFFGGYSIHTLSEEEIDESANNLFIFTPERYLSFLDSQKGTVFDFAFIDEILLQL